MGPQNARMTEEVTNGEYNMDRNRNEGEQRKHSEATPWKAMKLVLEGGDMSREC